MSVLTTVRRRQDRAIAGAPVGWIAITWVCGRQFPHHVSDATRERAASERDKDDVDSGAVNQRVHLECQGTGEVNHIRLRMTTGPFPTFVQSGRVIEAPVGIDSASWSDLARHIYQ